MKAVEAPEPAVKNASDDRPAVSVVVAAEGVSTATSHAFALKPAALVLSLAGKLSIASLIKAQPDCNRCQTTWRSA
eukprot:scaffold98289_cov37-Prasinocladus_malaysianus.AAC.1